ncbi:MAG: acyl-CoA dehydrogenase family protein, partial [Schleiferiaceae bacterium]
MRSAAAEFAAQRIAPHVMEWDEAQIFPKELFHEMGKLGFLGVLVSPEYGGAGMGYAEYITIVDEIAQVCGSIGLSVAAHNSLCTQHINQFGTEEQKRRWLPKLATGEWIGAWGLTETGTGSDAGGMNTTAVRHENGWMLNGSKNFITHAISGDVAVVIARTGEKGDSHGMTAFVVEKGTPGFQGGRKENKLGMRASETAGLFFDQCFVPDNQVLGNVGEGFIQSMKILDGGRISIAALSLGIAKGAHKAALRYSREREQFGQPIGDFQGIAFKLAEMSTKIYAAELMTRHAGSLKDQGRKVTQESAMAKLFASETAVEVATDGVQIHGGYGFTKDYPAEKYFRDSKLCTIGEGTSEIQKLVI